MPVQGATRQDLITCWHAGVNAVGGQSCVARALKNHGCKTFRHIIAAGKASTAMYQGARAFLADGACGVIVTKYGHTPKDLSTGEGIRILESAHPVPDQQSLLAGQALLEFVQDIAGGERLLVLVSGGASALAEYPVPGCSLAQLQELNRRLLTGRFDIGQMNAARKVVSRLKGGNLLGQFRGHEVVVLAISDVPGDDISVIGSGLGEKPDPESAPIADTLRRITDRIFEGDFEPAGVDQAADMIYRCEVVGCNAMARNGAGRAAIDLGYPVRSNVENLHVNIETAAKNIAGIMAGGEHGMYIFGGEPMLELPDNPGRGGRNQHLAVLLAQYFSRIPGCHALVAGTDGSDGPTQDAGGYVDSETVSTGGDPMLFLHAANAGEYLQNTGGLFSPGPTGTNVMDLVVVCKGRPD